MLDLDPKVQGLFTLNFRVHSYPPINPVGLKDFVTPRPPPPLRVGVCGSRSGFSVQDSGFRVQGSGFIFTLPITP